MKTPRQVALTWLLQVISKGRSVNELLALQNDSALQPQHRALAKQMLFGTLRYYHQLKTITDNLLEKPFKPKDTDLELIIIIGLYQMKYLSTPDHAAISESVELSRSINKKWAAGLINGVLRRFQREAEEIETSLAKSLQFQFSHPGWIVKKLKQDWPAEFEQVLTSNNLQAPMILRVNTIQNSVENYLAKLKAADISAQSHPIAIDGVILDKATDVMALPGFIEGKVTVQDAAAQLPIELLDLQSSQRVLDACAAPGGKTTHILQRQNSAKLTAIEMSSTRAEKIQLTLERLGLTMPDFDCQLKVSDVTNIDNWWDGELFDRILLDVPCSASGVIRRNPDIKVHRKVTDIQPLVDIQAKILQQCWQLLKPGGILVYATCSVFKEENQNQIIKFLNENQADILSMPAAIHQQLSDRAEVGYQILPGEFQMDGFYFCGLKKNI
jgi:16S rRNA (cytosine967-C5)-methyltransferase